MSKRYRRYNLTEEKVKEELFGILDNWVDDTIEIRRALNACGNDADRLAGDEIDRLARQWSSGMSWRRCKEQFEDHLSEMAEMDDDNQSQLLEEYRSDQRSRDLGP